MFSIIIPLDANRLELFKNTKRVYDTMPGKREFIIPTRTAPALRKYFKENDLGRDVRIIPYVVKAGFNCSKALNLGVRNAKYNSIVITSPEVMPMTSVLKQLEKFVGTNVVCQVWDDNVDGTLRKSLVNSNYRNDSPKRYFLAMFNKSDIEKINGWDEDFMKGFAFEDDDFGMRWVRAGIPFVFKDEIQARHQYHPKIETIAGGITINRQKLLENKMKGVIKCKNGLIKL